MKIKLHKMLSTDLLKIRAEIHITAGLIKNLKSPNIHKKLHTSLSVCGYT